MARQTVVLILVLTACAGGLPTLRHPDTRGLVGIQTEPTVSRLAIAVYREADSAGLEQALCLYGRVEGPPGKQMLHVTHAVRPVELMRSPLWVMYRCDRERRGYIGRWHTHLALTQPAANPMPSPIDEQDFWSDTRSLVMLIGVRLAARDTDTVLVTTWEFQDRRRGVLVMAGR